MKSHYDQQIITDGGTETFIKREPNEPVSQTIIRGIAEIEGVPECNLSPLYNSVEPELLNRLMKHSQRHQSDLSIEFTYEGWTILVRGDKEIKITDDALNCKNS
ncbi:HalOD1 output domain-containing protein [Natronorubrum thiooxidans]|uniref:Halobacterial output domain-containing protein n=1 Tax=Natronorubrum thiooxidans TaxID=308853 RepID=A0A1N7H807_9EURY|nr:HalOD1 output domain-containing protein [Natronorubrum thiooxidans]SIS20997.1 hypothetical protein SAMN05421752_1316 [Natronorubrum thiooxidans]